MRKAYRLSEHDEATLELGKRLVAVLVESKVTYDKALDALDAAEDILGKETIPVSV